MQVLEVAAIAAAMRVVKNSASLTAVNFVAREYYTLPPPMLSDVLETGATSGLATRLQKLTGIKVAAACADQQMQALRQCTSLTHLEITGSSLRDRLAGELAAALQAMSRLVGLHVCHFNLQCVLCVPSPQHCST